MKTLIIGALVTLLFLLYALITKQWADIDNIMLLVGAFGCLLGLTFTGKLQMGGRSRQPKYERKVFNRIAWVLGAIGIPNLIAGAFIYYSLHP